MGSRFPPEVIYIILLNFEKYDLLKSRHVSKVWNQESLKILQKSKYRQKLSHQDIAKYIEFAERSPQFVLPFQLSILFQHNSTEIIAKMNAAAEKLMEIFGKECILDINMYFDENCAGQTQIQALILLFEKTSLGLQTLNIFTYSKILNESSIQVAAEKFSFPKLKKFSLTTGHGTSSEHVPLWLQLIKNCPNLEELELLGISSSVEPNVQTYINSPFPLRQIKLLNYHNFTKEWVLKLIRQFPTPQHYYALRNLELSVSMTPEDQNIPDPKIKQILLAFSESLESLRLFFSRRLSKTHVAMPFPIFSKLRNLGIFFDSIIYSFFPVEYIEFEFGSTSFPALNSIQISPFVELCCTNETTFPQVNSLVLHVNEDIMDPDIRQNLPQLKPYHEYFENLQQIFPTVSSICVQNVFRTRSEGEGTLRYLLNGIIRSKYAKNIQEIILSDCDHNFLGDVLHILQNPPRIILENILGNEFRISSLRKSFGNFSGNQESEIIEEVEEMPDGQHRIIVQGRNSKNSVEKFKNVRKVKLLRTRISIRKDFGLFNTDNHHDEKKIHVDIMVKNFPSLKEIEISAYYFGSDFQHREKLIQDILKKFPGLIINVT